MSVPDATLVFEIGEINPQTCSINSVASIYLTIPQRISSSLLKHVLSPVYSERVSR